MDDRVFIRLPGEPHRNGYVTRTAYEALWSKKGYVIEGDDQHEEPEAPTHDDPAPETEEDETARLQGYLAAHGVKVDRRWGLKRLRTEAAAFQVEDPEGPCAARTSAR